MRKTWWLLAGVALILVGLGGIAILSLVAAPSPQIGVPGIGMMGGTGMMGRRFAKVPRPDEFTSNGEQIYFTGFDASGGRVLPSLMMARMMGLACADCHGADRRGGILMPDGATKSADISASGLRGITATQVAAEITQGVDEKGKALSGWMPVWQMPSSDLADLVDYLKTTP